MSKVDKKLLKQSIKEKKRALKSNKPILKDESTNSRVQK